MTGQVQVRQPAARFYQFGPFVFDASSQLLYRDHELVPLPPKVAETLLVLMENAGAVVSRGELLARVWRGAFVEEGSLSRAVSVLRRVLGRPAGTEEYVATLSRRGYRFTAGVTTAAAQHRQPAKVRLAVLPFEDLSGRSAGEYFSDGLTEELITQLGRINPERLGVIARASAIQYKGHRKSIRQIAKELRVSYVLQGSVRRAGKTTRIAVQLIEASDQTHVWAQAYEHPLRDILKLQAEVSHAVAAEIGVKLAQPSTLPPTAPPAIDPQAYEHYLRGRYLWNRRTFSGITQAIALYRQAIALAPESALPHAALADCYAVLASFPWMAPKQAARHAKTAARRALSLDSSLAEPHAALGLALSMVDRRWSEGEREFRQAIRLNEGYATAHHWFSFHLSALGRFDEAVAEISRAAELDPLSRIISTNHGTALFWARRYDEAIHRYVNVLAQDPDFWIAHWMHGLALEQKQSFGHAVAAQRRAMRSFPGKSPLLLAALARAYALAGSQREAARVLRQLEALPARVRRSGYDLGLAYAALGDLPKAFAILRRACAEREQWTAFIRVDPRVDGLRTDPRYRRLEAMVGFTR